MISRKQRTWLILAGVLAIALLWSLAAFARPGGGNSYSGSSRSSSGSSSSYRSSGSGSSGSSGGGGDASGLVLQLILLCVQYPAVGVPLLVIVVGFFVAKNVIGSGRQGWSTTTAEDVRQVQQVEQTALVSRMDLDGIRGLDPGFSLVLFEDFAYMLYAAVQRARGLGTQPIAAYLDPTLAEQLVDQQLADVQGIVIGAMRYTSFSGVQGPMLEIELEVEVNYVEVPKSGAQRRFYAVDRLVLTRATTARSRPFQRAHTLDCPNCGAPLESVRGTQCSYCQQNVGFGRYDWMVKSLQSLNREPRGPLLTSDAPEVGTELPTVVDRGAPQRFAAIQQKDPEVGWEPLQGRVGLIFHELHAAWAGRDALRIRPYVSDNLFQSMYYWIDLYTQAKCRNVTENPSIMRVDLANVMSDAYYDAITLRVFATGLDYTISDEGKLLSGSRSKPRIYSEYWTLIRGTARKGAPRREPQCPHCGAPMKIGMTGQCEYCRVKVTSGEFDWVLSRIEQDEAYGG